MKASKISVVCFDMWGTLMKGGGIKLWQELQEILHAQDTAIKDFIKLGESTIMLHPYSLRKGLDKFALMLKTTASKMEIEKAFQLWWSYVEKARPYEEAESVLQKIKHLNIPAFILSNTDMSSFHFVIKKYNWLKYFEKFFLSAKFGVLKPNVKIFETVQNYLSLPQEQILMVDDSLHHGVLPARQFGWQALWVARGKEGKDKGRIEDLRGIFDFL